MTEASVSGTNIQWEDFVNRSLQGPVIDDTVGLSLPVTNIPQLVERVKQYLKINNIACYIFANRVLNVHSSFFSTMLSSTDEMKWETLTKKQQVSFARMQYWMDHRATYGNNPRMKKSDQSKGKRGANPMPKYKKKPRTLLQSLNTFVELENAAANVNLGTASVMATADEVNNNGNDDHGDIDMDSESVDIINVEVSILFLISRSPLLLPFPQR